MIQTSIKIITWAVYIVSTLSVLLVIGLIFKLLVWDTLVVRILKMFKEIKEDKKSKEILEKDPFKRIKILRNLYNLIKDDIKHQKDEKFVELKYYQILQVFQFSLITNAEMASQTIHLSSYHFKNYISLKLIGNLEFKKQIFSKIKIIEEGVNHEKKQPIPLNTLTPSYTDQINELVNEFRQKPYLVQKYLRFIDFIIHEYFIHKKTINEIELNNS